MANWPRCTRPAIGEIPVAGFLLSLVLFACAAEAGDADEVRTVVEAAPLQRGEAQRERLCGRGNSDVVIDVFCSGEPPDIPGFTALRETLGVKTGLEPDRRYDTDYDGFVLGGHSTSLVTRSVSAINPRVIFIRPESSDVELLIMSFTRGDQFSETVVRDRVTGELRFYLTTFEQECNDAPGGCTPGDLLTEAADKGWKKLDVYAEEDLVNTTLDCLICHQPEGPGTKKFLRMQELDPPWSHWLYPYTEGGAALIEDYLAAKGDEPFVGLAGPIDLASSNPGLLSATLRRTGADEQPNEYVSSAILAEVKASAAAKGGMQPIDNSVPGESATWQAIYERSLRGEAIPVPYHDVKVTDAAKLARMTQAYVDYRDGRLPRQELPDIRDVFPDDPELLARMGFTTEPGLDGEGVLLQACSQCHNRKLDQSVSRSRFDVDLDTLSRTEKSRAIERLLLPPDDPQLMPPARLRTLDDEAKQRLIDLLER